MLLDHHREIRSRIIWLVTERSFGEHIMTFWSERGSTILCWKSLIAFEYSFKYVQIFLKELIRRTGGTQGVLKILGYQQRNIPHTAVRGRKLKLWVGDRYSNMYFPRHQLSSHHLSHYLKSSCVSPPSL